MEIKMLLTKMIDFFAASHHNYLHLFFFIGHNKNLGTDSKNVLLKYVNKHIINQAIIVGK